METTITNLVKTEADIVDLLGGVKALTTTNYS